ncbi:MAG TPA: peptidase S41, partial [Cyclobacteriaceae bacterium]|nr:peptidase S41 [Cyclobacteriaceae bacterium]
TLMGRTVYGGGGIMPDYFVPLDTTTNSKYLNALYNSNSLQEYTFNYAEGNKSQLEKIGFEKFQKEFVVTDEMLNNLTAVGKNNGTPPDFADLKKNKKVFQIHVRALVARKIWGNESYLPIINETNEILQQAVKMFDRIPELNRNNM